jgi:hypothetical protein
MKKKFPVACPLGVKTSITSSEVPAGTFATIGTLRTVPEALSNTWTVVVAIWVRVPPGNAPPLLVYKRTVTGCVPPAPVASSTPKETELTLYSAPPTKVPMLNALQ